MPRSERSFVGQFRFFRASCGGSQRGLLRSDFCVMESAQHLESTVAVGTGFEMMVASGPVPATIAWRDVVDLAIAARGRAAMLRAAVLGLALGG